MAKIISIVYTPPSAQWRPDDCYACVPLGRATLVKGRGIEGDAKGGGRRQLNVLFAEDVAALAAAGFRTAPGELGEQLVIAGLGPDGTSEGVRLLLGTSAVIEVTMPRAPCQRFARVQGRAADEANGRLGVLARVVHEGEIAVGDAVSVVGRFPAPPGAG